MIKENGNCPPGSGCRVVGRYHSRRNRVLLVSFQLKGGAPGQVVLKIYPAAEGAAAEYRHLSELAAAGISVPQPLALDGFRLYLQHLEGLLLTEIVERSLVPQAVWTESLAQWYCRLHRATLDREGNVFLKTDNNLRNFIYREGSFYGLDFEDCSRGAPARDIGQLCAFILADRPAFTGAKQAAVAELVARYLSGSGLCSPEEIQRETRCELERMAARRLEEREAIKAFIDYLSVAGNAIFPRPV